MSKGEFKQAVGRLLLEGACAFSVDGASEIIRSHSRIGEGEGEDEKEEKEGLYKDQKDEDENENEKEGQYKDQQKDDTACKSEV